MEYKGMIVEESLEDNRILNGLRVVDFEISDDDNPADRWRVYTVLASDEDIEKLSNSIKSRWYMHFWNERNIVVIFRDKKFEFNYDDKSTWKDVTEYGLSIGIPEEQLDFPID